MGQRYLHFASIISSQTYLNENNESFLNDKRYFVFPASRLKKFLPMSSWESTKKTSTGRCILINRRPYLPHEVGGLLKRKVMQIGKKIPCIGFFRAEFPSE